VKPKGILVAVDREELSDAEKELLEATNLRMYSILEITEIFDFLLNKEIECRVYADEKVKKDFEEYFRKHGRKC
jgi:orotate phosphoribosyltransferase